MTAADAASQLRNVFPESTFDTVEFRGEHTVVAAGASLPEILRHCRDELGFDYLVDISSLDHFGEEPRFEMVYELYGYGHGCHLRIRARVSEDQLEVETASHLWPTANWHEREVYDMMGIRFRNHPDLRRILMWEGYPYFPLRKDFPLAGKPSVMPDVAFSGVAPLDGGPFVTSPSSASTVHREPRARDA